MKLSFILALLITCVRLTGQTPVSTDHVFFTPTPSAATDGKDALNKSLQQCSSAGGGIVLLTHSLNTKEAWRNRTIPSNCTIWDLRSNALDIFTDVVDNEAGHSAGLGIFIGETIPTTNPVIHNPVGIYTSVQGRVSHRPVWGLNYVVNAWAEGPAIGIEGDLGRFTPEDVRYSIDQMKFVGGSPYPASTVLRIGGAHGTHRTGFRMDGVSTEWIGNTPENVSNCLPKGIPGYGCLGTFEPWSAVLATAVTPSTQIQSVRSSQPINDLAGNWMWASCDNGDHQEDIYPIAVTNETFKAVFHKSHVQGIACHWYGALSGIDLGNSYFKDAPIILGNIYGTIQYGIPHFPSISVYDATSKPGSEMLRDVFLFDRESHVILKSLGTGIHLENKDGMDIVQLGETGDIASQGSVAARSITTSRGTPKSSHDTCVTGELWSDTQYVYVCTAENTIRRSKLDAW
ncbi:hypothetical protein [Terriglobus sp. ADX1]|uniref:hypothetical protein n=1 Tax=Terriglobus sp. ADX1 TaxID=2794063 RepID=UPI002FE63696